MTEDDAKPFSIRHYVSGSRQEKDIAHHWPFPDKYLKICLSKGITNILPPLLDQLACTPNKKQCHSDEENNKVVSNDPSTRKLETNIIHPETCGVAEANQRTNSVKEAENRSSFNAKVSHLTGLVDQLCLSTETQKHSAKITTTTKLASSRINNCSSTRTQSGPLGNRMRDINLSRRWRKKGRPKKKSLEEIFAVAKHCVLDGSGSINGSAGVSILTVPHHGGPGLGRDENRVEVDPAGCRRTDNGIKDSRSEFTEDWSYSKKKHKRCSENNAGGRNKPFKKSRLGGVSRKRCSSPESKGWKRGLGSYKSSESIKRSRGYKRKSRET